MTESIRHRLLSGSVAGSMLGGDCVRRRRSARRTAGTSCQVPIMNGVTDTVSLPLTYATTGMNDYLMWERIAEQFVGSSHDVAYNFDYTLPSYDLANARVNFAHGDWSDNLFTDNLLNKAALMTANNTSVQFNTPRRLRYTTNQPHTFGMQANYKF